MKNLSILDIFVFTLFIINVKGQNSPCPNVFQFKIDGNIKYGIITIPGPGEGKTVVIAGLGIYGEVYSNKGGLKLLKSLDETVADAKRGKNVQYILNFPQSEGWPVISNITLNYQTICDGQETINSATWKYEHSFTYPSGRTQLSVPNRQSPGFSISFPNNNPYQPYPETSQREPDRTQPPPTRAPPRTPAPSPPRPVSSSGPAKPDNPDWLRTFRFDSTCGTRENFNSPGKLKPTELIIGGVPVEVGEYPWMVAMYFFERKEIKYVCGATLVTDRHVITAAHCTKGQSVVLLLFGKHDLSKNEPSSVQRTTNDILEHPEYSEAHADIAIITFDPVEFSNTIKPICIWRFGTFFDTTINRGTITGWGQPDIESDSSDLPIQLNITRTDITTCRNSNTQLRTLATDKTFCAGGNSKGPCRGDSGSGFYIVNNNKFYLRGIISHSIASTPTGPCRLDQYAVYTDLIYFLDWIKNKIN